MSGLFIKDLYLMGERKQGLLIFLIIAVMMAFTTDGTFAIAYMTFLCTLFTTSTISYDDFDNGFSYLMTLPVTARDYVAEKYLFCISGGIAAWALATAVLAAKGLFGAAEFGMEAFISSIIYIPVSVIILDIMIPIILKYGAEKGRIALAIFGGGCFVLGMTAGKLVPEAGLWIDGAISKMDNVNPMVVLGITFIIACVTLVISMMCSRHILEQKEY